MADAVDVRTINDGDKNLVVHLQSVSDGTGESAVQKIDISGLSFSDGRVPTTLSLQEIQWDMQGINYVQLLFDATTDDEMVTLSGNGYKNFEDVGGLSDPQSTGYTGDILLTTGGATSGGSYDIIARFSKKA
jgi:hypothetical protein